MKHLYSIIIFLISFTVSVTANASTIDAEGYTVKGKILNYNKSSIILQELNSNGSAIPFDTAIVDKEGNFTFKGFIGGKTFTLMNFGPYRNVFLTLSNQSDIEISINAGSTLQYTVVGDAASEDISKIANIVSDYNQRIVDLNDKAQNTPNISIAERGALSKKVDNLMAELTVKQQETLKLMQSPMAKIFAIELLKVDADFETEKKLVDVISKKPSNKWFSLYSTNAGSRIRTAVGAKAPNITLNTPDGEPYSLSSLKGKYVLIDFWASWCRPCRAENPNVVRMYNKFKDKDFEILGVSLDKSLSSWKNAITADGLIWKHISDLKQWNSDVVGLYNVTSIPKTVLLNKEGVIIAKGLRGEQLEKKLEEILK